MKKTYAMGYASFFETSLRCPMTIYYSVHAITMKISMCSAKSEAQVYSERGEGTFICSTCRRRQKDVRGETPPHLLDNAGRRVDSSRWDL